MEIVKRDETMANMIRTIKRLEAAGEHELAQVAIGLAIAYGKLKNRENKTSESSE